MYALFALCTTALREINRAGIGMEQADPLAVLPDPVPKLPAGKMYVLHLIVFLF